MNTRTQSLDFLQRCTAVNVRFGSLSFSKKLPQSAVTTESNPDRISASKKLLDCEQADAIKSEFSRLGKVVKSKTLPSPFGKGIYCVPNTLLGEVDAELVIAQTQTIPRLCEALLSVYGEVMTKEEIALGPNFNASDYDTPGEVRERLRVEFDYVTFGVPENLPNAMYAREQGKAQAKLAEAVDTMQALLRAEMAKLLDHAIEKLAGKKDDGKPLAFKNTLTSNIKDFLKIFRDRNITEDKELEALCDKASQLLEGVDPQDLREKPPLRDSVASGFADIRAQLDGMMVPRGSRSIILDDDEPVAA